MMMRILQGTELEHQKSKKQLKRERIIEERLGLKLEEIEKLSYYNLLSLFDFPFTIISGLSASERLAEMCEISEEKKVLIIGSGNGFTALHFAKKLNCEVIGIDLAENMVIKAREKAEREGLTHKAEFKVGDAYKLEFANSTFDAVITEFVSQFLDLDKAFKEFARVLKPVGFIGVNEIFRKEDVPSDKKVYVKEAEAFYTESIGLPLTFKPPSEWTKWLEDASLEVKGLEEHIESIKGKEAIRVLGGWKSLFGILGTVIKLMRASKKVRETFSKINKAKRNTFAKKKGGKYIGYILVAAKKK